MITNERSAGVRNAGDNFGITLENFKAHSERNRHDYTIFWESLFAHIRYQHMWTGDKNFSYCDLGSGAGAKTARIAYEARAAGLNLQVATVDKRPGNTYQTKRALKEVGIENANCSYGDITEQIPPGPHHLITCFEAIHWLTPEENVSLFRRVRQELLDKHGYFAISFATKWNNALVLDSNGELNINRGRFKERPIHRYSWACDKQMTFWEPDDLKALASECGLKTIFCLQISNPYYPTRIKLNIPLVPSQATCTENTNMIFQAI